MKKISLSLISWLILAMSQPSFAGGIWEVHYQNIKLPSQAVLEHVNYPAPGATSINNMVSGQALTNGSSVLVSSFLAQPDVARNVIITPGGSTGSVGAGNIVVSGLNQYGQSISESIVITAASNTKITGSKAFKSISSILFPAATGLSASISVGYGDKLGLSHCMNHSGEYVFSEFAGVYDSSRGMVAADATHVESNTFIPASSMDGVSDVDVYFVQNYRCY